MNNIQHLTMVVEECTARIRAGTARIEAFQQKQRERREARTADGLPKWRRRLKCFEMLPDGSIIIHGKYAANTVYIRPDYGAAEVSFLREIVSKAPRETFTAEQAFRWLESRRHGRIIPRKLLDAAPDPINPEWRSRPARVLTAEQMIGNNSPVIPDG